MGNLERTDRQSVHCEYNIMITISHVRLHLVVLCSCLAVFKAAVLVPTPPPVDFSPKRGANFSSVLVGLLVLCQMF